MKKSYSLFLLWILLPLLSFSQNGSTCSNPIALGDVDCSANQIMTGNEMWFSITATAQSHHFQVNNLDTSNGYIEEIGLYPANCFFSALYSQTIHQNKKHLIWISASGLTPGASYLICVKRAGANPSDASFTVCREDWHSATDDCDNPCNMICNGSFENFTRGPSGDCLNCSAGTAQFDVCMNAHCWYGLGVMEQYAYVGTTSPDYLNTCAPIQCLPINYAVTHSCEGAAGIDVSGLQASNLYREFIYQPGITVSVPGVYKVSFWVKRMDGSQSASIGFWLTQNTLSSFNFSVSQVPNHTATITGSNHAWTQISASVNLTAGSYSLVIGVFGNQNTNYLDYFHIDDVVMSPAPPLITVSPTPACSNSPLNFLATTGYNSYLWTCSPSLPGFPSTASSFLIPPSIPPGYYTVNLYATTNGGCSSESVLVHVLPGPTAILSPTGDINLCDGQSVVLTATSSYPPGIEWFMSPNASGQGSQSLGCIGCTTFVAAQTGYYYFVVTDPVTGCSTRSGMAHVIIHDNPTPGIIAAADEGCSDANDGSITAGATDGTPPYTYSWSTNPIQTNATATGLDAGTYTVTITDANGCTAQASVSIGSGATPAVPIIITNNANGNLCGSASVTYTITNYNSSLNYTFTYNPQPVSVSNVLTGVYTVNWGGTCNDVAFSVTVDNGSPLCEAEASVTIARCCACILNANDAIMYGTNTSNNNVLALQALYNPTNNSSGIITHNSAGTVYTYNNPNGILYINGNFLVPAGKTFNVNSSQVRFGANAKILLLGNAQMNVNGSHFLAGCNAMWDGIYIAPQAVLTITNSALIEDAINAVVSVGGGQYTINDAVFNKNRINVDVRAYAFNHPGTIRNTVFTCRKLPANATTAMTKGTQQTAFIQIYPVSTFLVTDLLPPYAGQRSYAGVYVEQAGTTVVNSNTHQVVNFTSVKICNQPGYNNLNVFDNLDYGVYAKNSNVEVRNNAFQYITGPTTVTKPGQETGIAIYGIADGGQGAAKVFMVGSNNNNLRNTFYDCNRGADLNAYYRFDVINNRFQSTQVYSPNSPFQSPVGNYGIFAKSGNYIDVNLNDNVIINWSVGIAFFGDVVIVSPQQQLKFFGDARINNNQIRPTELLNAIITTEYVRQAIIAQSIIPPCAPACLSSNILGRVYINNNDLYKVFNGIHCQGWIKPPQIASTGTQQQNIYLRFQPNFFQVFPQAGIRAIGCERPVIYRNNIDGESQNTSKQKARGIYCTNNGAPYVHCNVINNVGQCMVFEGSNNLATIYDNEMYTSQDGFVLLNNGIVGPQGVLPNAQYPTGIACDNKWFGPFSHAATFTDNTLNPNIHSPLYYRLPGTSITHPSGGLNQTTGQSGFDDYNCPNGFIAAPVNAQIRTCLAPPPIAPPGGGQPNQRLVLETIIQDTTLPDSAAQWMRRQQVYRALRQDVSLMNGSPMLQQFYAAEQTANVGKVEDVDDEFAGNNPGSALTMNSTIVPQNILEQNHQLVNTIYTALATGSPVSSQQITDLETIAYQCPLEGGNAIYRARTLLCLVMDQVIFFEDSCKTSVQDVRLHRQEQLPLTGNTNVCTLYPNPNDGNMSLSYTVPSEQTAIFTIFDMTGRQIAAYNLESGTQMIQVDLSTLSAGMYYYTFMLDGKIEKSEKIIISK